VQLYLAAGDVQLHPSIFFTPLAAKCRKLATASAVTARSGHSSLTSVATVMIVRSQLKQVVRSGAIIVLALVGMAAELVAGRPCGVRPQDRITLVNTRPVGCTTNVERLAAGVRASEYVATAEEGCRKWQSADAVSLLASATPDTPLVIYIHGNQIEPYHAIPTGLLAYRRLIACAQDDRPIHFMIFSWPSEKVPGFLKDYRVKAARTKPVAWQFAWLMEHVPPDVPMGWWGYSYGSRVASGGAHLMAGGSLGRLALPSASAADRPIHAVFFAAALDCEWLAEGRYYGRALTQIDRMLLSTNRLDPAMTYYKYVSTTSDPTPLGYAGPCCLDAARRKEITCRNVTEAVGRTHAFEKYVCVSGLMARTWRSLTFADEAAPVPALASR
jgi:hypothetical protein